MRVRTVIAAIVSVGFLCAAYMVPAMPQNASSVWEELPTQSPTPEMVNQCTQTIVRVYTSANSNSELTAAYRDVPSWCLDNFERNTALTDYQKAGCDKIQERFNAESPKILTTVISGKTVRYINPKLVIPPSACQAYERKKLQDQNAAPKA
jgi:hypothetical protein